MQKLWCAGAVAGGILLFGAAPAQADALPGPGAVLDQASPIGDTLAQNDNGQSSAPVAADPLSGQPLLDLRAADRELLQLKPGDNTGLTRTFPARHDEPLLEAVRRRLPPPADVISGTQPDRPARSTRAAVPGARSTRAAVPATRQARSFLPIDTLVQATVPAVGAIGPDGVAMARNSSVARPGHRPLAERAAEPAGVPMAGGLGGTLSATSDRQRLSGMPPGGSPVVVTTVRPAASPSTPAVAVSPSAPAVAVSPSAPAVAVSPSAPALAVSPSAPAVAVAPGAPAVVATSGAPVVPSPPAFPAAAAGSAASATSVSPKAHRGKAAAHRAAAHRAAKQRVDDPRLLEEPTEGLPSGEDGE